MKVLLHAFLAMHILNGALFASTAAASTLSVEPTPCGSVRYPGSTTNLHIFTPDDGTQLPQMPCSGITWFHNDEYIAILDFIHSSMDVYRFDEATLTATRIQHLTRPEIRHLINPVDISLSVDESLVAVTNYGYDEGGVAVFKIDPKTHKIDPNAVALLSSAEKTHGVQFSPDGNFLVYTNISPRGSIEFFRIGKNKTGAPTFTPTHQHPNDQYPLRPKAITFTPDMRYVIVGSSPSVADKTSTKEEKNAGLIEVFAFDKDTGTIDRTPVGQLGPYPELKSIEDILVTDDSSQLIVSNTLFHTLTLHDFNADTAEIGPGTVILENPSAQLYHPHGFSMSTNGKYLAITNNNNVNVVMIYKVTKD